MTQALDSQARLLLFIFTLFSFASLLSGTFVPVYLWKQSASYLHIGHYILGQYISSGILFYIFASVAKQGKKRLLLQLGCGVATLFYGLLLYSGSAAYRYVFMLGLVYGMGLALFWLAYNVFYFEITEADNRDLYNGWQGMLVAGCTIIAPFLASKVIVLLGSEVGYPAIFICSLVLYVLIIALSIKLVQRRKGAAYQWLFPLKAFLIKQPDWQRLGLAIIAQGVREGMFLTLLPFIVFVTTSNESEVGLYTLISGCIALVANFIVGKKIKAKWRGGALYLGAFGSALAVGFILISPNITGLLLFGSMTSLLWPLFIIPFTSIVFDSIGQTKEAVELKEEIIVFREVALMAGRLIGLIPFFVYSVWLHDLNVHVGWLLLLVGLFPLLSSFFINKQKRNKLNF